MQAGSCTALLAAGFLLAACELPDDIAPGPEPAAPPTGDVALPEAITAGIHITSLAALPGRMPFTLPAMERAFPGHDIISVPEDPAAGTPPAFHIREPGSEAARFIVTPDWSRGLAAEIATSDPGIEGPGGIRAGVSRQSEVAAALGEACAAPQACEILAEGVHMRLEFEQGGEADPRLSRLILLLQLP